MAKHPGGQNPYTIEKGYRTERGEIVRSKSEKIIADYEKNGILLGRDLILTVETAKDMLDVKLLEEKIRTLLIE